ncbi:MAG: FtsX-like permease family protein [Rhizomicrobium sp.]
MFKGGDSVIIGARLAAKLDIAPGGSITLIAPRGNVTPFGVTPRIKTYTVAGTFNIGMSEYDSTFVFMPLDEAQLYFNLADSVTGLEVMVSNPDDVNAMLKPLGDAAGPGARVLSWQAISSSLFQALQVEANVMFLILAIITLVAAFNIVSTLIMLVKDKSGDIAILRTMGATRGAVTRIFFIAGASIGNRRHRDRASDRHAVLRQYREHPPGPVAHHRHDAVRPDDLFPRTHAGAHRDRRCRVRRGAGARPVVPRHALPRLARRASRSGGGAAL